jgi:hypothetical protein
MDTTEFDDVDDAPDAQAQHEQEYQAAAQSLDRDDAFVMFLAHLEATKPDAVLELIDDLKAWPFRPGERRHLADWQKHAVSTAVMEIVADLVDEWIGMVMSQQGARA